MQAWSVECGAWSVGAGVSWGSGVILLLLLLLLVLVLSADFEDEEEKEDEEEEGNIANSSPTIVRFDRAVIT
jgi:hypothetical protein